MYDTLRTLSHILDGYYIFIIIGLFYICMAVAVVETVLRCWKDKSIIDYIFEWYDRRKNGKNKRNT